MPKLHGRMVAVFSAVMTPDVAEAKDAQDYLDQLSNWAQLIGDLAVVEGSPMYATVGGAPNAQHAPPELATFLRIRAEDIGDDYMNIISAIKWSAITLPWLSTH